jgi:tryptophan synthase beta subunit
MSKVERTLSGLRMALARILRTLVDSDHQGFYVIGSGPVRVPSVRSHQVPKVIAEHHREQAKRELQRALIIGRR